MIRTRAQKKTQNQDWERDRRDPPRATRNRALPSLASVDEGPQIEQEEIRINAGVTVAMKERGGFACLRRTQ